MRRWLVLPLLAAVVLAAAAPASGHVRTGRNLVPRHGALFGAFVNSTGDAWANVVGLQRTLGYRLTIVHHYRPWSITSYRIDKSALAHRQIPMISWSPGGTTTAAEITNGSQDALITRTARDIKALHKKIFVRLAYEMDQPRGHPRYIGTPSEFVPAWRHVVRIFHRVGAKNARFVWCAIAANFKTGHVHPARARDHLAPRPPARQAQRLHRAPGCAREQDGGDRERGEEGGDGGEGVVDQVPQEHRSALDRAAEEVGRAGSQGTSGRHRVAPVAPLLRPLDRLRPLRLQVRALGAVEEGRLELAPPPFERDPRKRADGGGAVARDRHHGRVDHEARVSGVVASDPLRPGRPEIQRLVEEAGMYVRP